MHRREENFPHSCVKKCPCKLEFFGGEQMKFVEIDDEFRCSRQMQTICRVSWTLRKDEEENNQSSK